MSSALTTSATGGRDSLAGQIVCVDVVQITNGENRSNPRTGDPVPSLTKSSQPVVYAVQAGDIRPAGQTSPALVASNTDNEALLITQYARRLTPLERERVMGLPDGWTEGLSDARRAMVVGNGAAVPVLEWIGRRLSTAIEGAREEAA